MLEFHFFVQSISSLVKQNEKLTQLSGQDCNEIYKAVLLYPHKEEAPEIICIDYKVDFELEVFYIKPIFGTKTLKQHSITDK